MISISTFALIVLAACLGVLLGWLTTRSRTQALVQAAAAEARASMEVALATATAKIAGLNEAVEHEREQHVVANQSVESLRLSLEELSNEKARLTERASRLTSLEVEVASLSRQVEAKSDELRELSMSDAQKGQLVSSLSEQVQQMEVVATKLRSQGEAATESLQASNEKNAGLEEQVTRVQPLEQELELHRKQLSAVQDEFTRLRESSSGELARLTAELSGEREALRLARQEVAENRTYRDSADRKYAELIGEFSELRTRTDDERVHADEKLQLLMDAKEALSAQFKNLATDILEEKSKRFAEQNQTSIGQLLEPLKSKLTEFQTKVEEVYINEGKDRSALSEQVRHLLTLNQALSQDAKNLTQALKGQAKTQGNWGELILERVLEASGLRKGYEYKVQDSQTREDGSRAQPDVVIELPENRSLVIDAKVSLVAYDRYASADTDEERAVALRQHLDSVRAHIKGLSEKRYQDLYGLQSMDFVLAFIPIEPAFMLAVTNDSELFMNAWERNVLLVSPSTLLFVVRTVAHLWRQESQSRNAQEIAKRGADLYDKLCGFVNDLQEVGKKLGQARAAYDDAHAKLATGKGNAIRQAEMLRELGVKPSKLLPAALAQIAAAEDDTDIPLLNKLATNGGRPTADLTSPIRDVLPSGLS